MTRATVNRAFASASAPLGVTLDVAGGDQRRGERVDVVLHALVGLRLAGGVVAQQLLPHRPGYGPKRQRRVREGVLRLRQARIGGQDLRVRRHPGVALLLTDALFGALGQRPGAGLGQVQGRLCHSGLGVLVVTDRQGALG